MRFHHISISGLARNGCRWPIFDRNTPITLRSRQQTVAADDLNTTSCLTGSEYSTSQVTGSTFLSSRRGFRIVDLRVQTAVFVVSVKTGSGCLSTGRSFARPEVAFSGRDTATPITPRVNEFSVSTPSPHISDFFQSLFL